MPVSLCEWRVRIGTFVHWIRDYEVRERKERLLKERTRRLKVLCERLKAKMGDSEQESQDDGDNADESKQNGSDPKQGCACSHKTANRESLGNSSDIEDLLASCDECIQDLLTRSDSHINDKLTLCDSSIKDLITQNECSNGNLTTLNASTIKDEKTPKDPHIKDLFTANDSRIQDLVTADYSSIEDIITAKDSSIKDVIASKEGSIKHIDIQNDSDIEELTSLNDSSIKDLITPNDSNIIDVITANDSNIKDLIESKHSCIKDLIKSHDSKVNLLCILRPKEPSFKELIKPNNYFSEEKLAQTHGYVETVHAPNADSTGQVTHFGDSEEHHMSAPCITQHHSLSDAPLKELLAPSYLSIKELLTPTVNLNAELITNIPSCIREHQTLSAGSVKELLPATILVHLPIVPPDDFIVELLQATASVSKDLLPSTDPCIHEPDRPGYLFFEDNHTLPYYLSDEQHYLNDALIKERPIPTDGVFEEYHASSETCKYLHTVTNPPMEVKNSLIVPNVSMKSSDSGRYGKEKEMLASATSCHGPSLKSKTGFISEVILSISEQLLLKSGDVELNPGPREGPAWSLELERELQALVDDISPEYYSILCNSLGFGRATSQAILSKNQVNFPKSLFEIICSWGVKQKDGTNYREALAVILRRVHLDALATKLLQGEYLPQDNPPPASTTDRGQHLNQLTPEQVTRCGQDFKTFYRTRICKIKTDPLDFNSILEFEKIYTNLVLLRNETGKKTRAPLKYNNLLKTKINNEFSKRLMAEGEAGAGKSTFCSKIAWDWSNGCQEFEQFEWILLIPMRDIQDGQTIGDIAKTYLSDGNTVRPNEIDNYILAEPSKVFIIFDGLDEYSGDIIKHRSDVARILRSEKFKECTVLVTTRPWKANQIKSNENLCKTYTFIGVEGFSSQNVSSYIAKYFAHDEVAGTQLNTFIEDNDVIKENMAPFPIYVAMLCILWRDSTSERRDMICKFKTFSQLFKQMIMFLKDHYVSKLLSRLEGTLLSTEMRTLDKFLFQIGAIAFNGLLERQLTFDEDSFRSCQEAMVACCRIGVISKENRVTSRWERSKHTTQPVTSCVFFPHKLFQEYLSALYLAFLYDSNREEYANSIAKALQREPSEFKYLFYFTASQETDLGFDIIKKLIDMKYNDDFLVDVVFEAYDAKAGNAVGQTIFTEGKTLTIDVHMPAHTFSGYLFIMEKCSMETLIIKGRRCGPTVSRDMADVLSSSRFLTNLQLSKTILHDDFYRFMLDHITLQREPSMNSVLELHVDHIFINGLQKFDLTIEVLFPSLKQLRLKTFQTVSPGIVKRLAHSRLSVLSIEQADYKEYQYYQDEYEDEDEDWDEYENVDCQIPLIGDPDCLGQLFSSSFPLLTSLTFEKLVIGNLRIEAILRTLRNHLHLKSMRIVNCFTDDELDPLALQITTESRMEITLQHDTEQHTLLLAFPSSKLDLVDALCHRTCVRELTLYGNKVKISNEELIPDLHGREVDSKIHTCVVERSELHDDQSASRCLGKFLCLLPCLTDLKIDLCSFHDEFYKEIADRASSSKIHTCAVEFLNLHDDQSASRCLGKFLCLLPCLTDLKIVSCSFHDEFYKEIADRASSSKIHTCAVEVLNLHDNQSASRCLGKFLCLLPCLTNLKIALCSFHDAFYKEIADHASSSKIHTFVMDVGPFKMNPLSQSASKQLVRFLCFLPCLTDLTLMRFDLHDDFFSELESLAASSQNPYFMNNKHSEMLLRHQRLNLAHQHQTWSLEEHGPYPPHLSQSALPSVHHQDDHQSGNQSKPEQVQHSPSESVQEARPPGLEETSQHPVGQGSGDTIQGHIDCTSLVSSSDYINARTSLYPVGGHSIGMTPMCDHDPDRPSTSGLSSADSRRGGTTIDIDPIRVHCDSDDGDDDTDSFHSCESGTMS